VHLTHIYKNIRKNSETRDSVSSKTYPSTTNEIRRIFNLDLAKKNKNIHHIYIYIYQMDDWPLLLSEKVFKKK
jgi:hypothetical protein